MYDRAPDARIEAGTRWAWGPPDRDGLSRAEGALVPADSIDDLLRRVIEAELVAKGFPRAEPESAQFMVHFHVARRSVTDTIPPRDDPTTPGVSRAPGSWGSYGRPEDLADRLITWEEGMMIIDAIVPDRGIVAWRGMIAGEIPPQAEARPEAAVRQAVRRLLRGFP